MMPPERILVETDCPYLSAQAYRGKRNEPAYITLTVHEIAKLKAIEFETLSQILTANSMTLFGLR